MGRGWGIAERALDRAQGLGAVPPSATNLE